MAQVKSEYDIIVVGAGHAGSEAALASARLGLRAVLVTLSLDNIGVMSCNPAIGGVGKGQLVKEIDALGGEMGKAADHGGIQFRQLNASKGAAARSSRAQEDRQRYMSYMRSIVFSDNRITVIEDAVIRLLVKDKTVYGVQTRKGKEIYSKAVIITTGTFMNSLIHIGMEHHAGGRIGEETISAISSDLKSLGFKLMRFKTGTCMRLDKGSIDFSKCQVQEGDKDPIPFSFTTKSISVKQMPCYVTYTNERTHEIIRRNLDRSPLYSGKIKATGVRYCPSIEDKVVRFADKTRHQIFLEPEGMDSKEYYPNGLATSLPEDVQRDIVHSIDGLENAKIIRMGYGIEYDLIDPTQLFHTLESKTVKGLYFAGQVNGTTGYEEAAAQGLVAGVNAALFIKGKEPLILDRSTSYIGILIDDLVTKGTNEPYRMFTSRVEYRLSLREDNADERLSDTGKKIGLLSDESYMRVQTRQSLIKEYMKIIKDKKLKPTADQLALLRHKNIEISPRTESLYTFLKMPHVTFSLLREIGLYSENFPADIETRIETEVKYAGYIAKQAKEIKLFKNLEKIKIPADTDFFRIHGLSSEIREKLDRIRPVSLGQASRISGVTPVAISVLMVYLRK